MLVLFLFFCFLFVLLTNSSLSELVSWPLQCFYCSVEQSGRYFTVFYVNSRSLIGANLHYVHRGRTARFEFTSCMCFFLLIYILYLRYGFGCQGARKFRCLDFYFFDSKQTVYHTASESCKCSWSKIEWKFLTCT